MNQTEQYNLVGKAIAFVKHNHLENPSLEDIAKHVHLSKYHFHRIFTDWAGTTPERFIKFLTKEHLKKLLYENKIDEASEKTNLSSTSRAHDLLVTYEAITPAEFKNMTFTIEYGFAESPFGEVLIGFTKRGICFMAFVQASREEALTALKRAWPKVPLQSNNVGATQLAQNIFKQSDTDRVKILIKGTNFQIKVWEALLKIPEGQVRSYGDIAHSIGKPKAVRAVGNACGRNNISYLIPCHRVLKATAEIGQYRWGKQRKELILGKELSISNDQ